MLFTHLLMVGGPLGLYGEELARRSVITSELHVGADDVVLVPAAL